MKELTRRDFLKLLGLAGVGAYASQIPARETPSNAHVNKMLANILVDYRNSAYWADEIFPVVDVDDETNT